MMQISRKAGGVNKQRVVHHYLERLDPYIGSAEYEFQELCARDAAGTTYVGKRFSDPLLNTPMHLS